MHKLLIIVIRIKSVKEFTNYWEGSNYSLDKYKTRFFFHKKENSDSFFKRERKIISIHLARPPTNPKALFFSFNFQPLGCRYPMPLYSKTLRQQMKQALCLRTGGTSS